MQYDFGMAANSSQRIEVAGSFFKYKSGSGPIRVLTSVGGYIDLVPGQGVSGLSFSGLSIKDMSGAPNVGIIVAGKFEFTDDTITGSLAIADPYVATLNNQRDFIGSVDSQVATGNYNLTGISNAAGSGRNLIVDRCSFVQTGAGTVGFNLQMGPFASAAPIVTGMANKKAGGAAPVAARLLADSSAGLIVVAGMTLVVHSAGQTSVPQVFEFKKPIILPPGYALFSAPSVLNASVSGNFEFSEVLI